MAEQIDVQKSNKYLYITGAIIAIIVIGLVTNGFGLMNNINSNVINNQQYISLEIKNSPFIGSPNAPLTIYEFSDFSCPYCQAATGNNQPIIEQLTKNNRNWEAPIPKIISEYVEAGKVNLVFKYFPGHGTGKAAHQVSLAMAEQGLFEEFHNAAFKNYNDVSSLSKMKDLAESLGADMDKLEADLNTNDYYNVQLQEDYAMGISQGVSGTPTFIINGKEISGAQSFSSFKSFIDAELR